MSNLRLAESILRSCAQAGVAEFVLCAGARNAPLVSVLSLASGVKTYSFFEERSAAFFALGRMQATGRPVAVITTSGTAAAELLPAAIEADYQGLPLILLTADRPRRYRGSGAPQTIVQPGIFSHYVEKSWDIEGTWSGTFADVSWTRPLHLNICFDEPILDGRKFSDLEYAGKPEFVVSEFRPARAASPAPSPSLEFRSPLVLIGGLPLDQVDFVRDVVRQWRFPIYAEAPSQLRGQLGEFEILEASIRELDFDGVVRIGSVPTLRLWRDLEDSKKPVVHFSHLPYAGLSRSQEVHPLSALRECRFALGAGDFIRGAADKKKSLTSLLEKFPLSEPGWVNWLSRQVPSSRGRVFLGNSLPIREWDLAASQDRAPRIFVNRGANGIDGLISTFLGLAEVSASNWAVIGDLSALYDLSGPWALGQRADLKDINIVVINNGGGKIFQRIFHNPLFENRHELNFADWAKMWNLDYLRLETPRDLGLANKPRVIEIVPQELQTESFWKEWR